MKRKADFMMQNVRRRKIASPARRAMMELNGVITLNDTAACVVGTAGRRVLTGPTDRGRGGAVDVATGIASADVQTFLDEITRLGLLAP